MKKAFLGWLVFIWIFLLGTIPNVNAQNQAIKSLSKSQVTSSTAPSHNTLNKVILTELNEEEDRLSSTLLDQENLSFVYSLVSFYSSAYLLNINSAFQSWEEHTLSYTNLDRQIAYQVFLI